MLDEVSASAPIVKHETLTSFFESSSKKRNKYIILSNEPDVGMAQDRSRPPVHWCGSSTTTPLLFPILI